MNKDIVVLIPIYNPDLDITNKFLKELETKFMNLVFVNDGCDSFCNDFFDNLSKKYPVIKHNVNLGKGRGIKNGINYILNNYNNSKVIVIADCDGQHTVKDILNVANKSLKNLDSLVLGVRDFHDKSVPFNSKYGNTITKNIFRIMLGQKVNDTQTGLRAMSFNVARCFIDTYGERYEYETKVLIDAKKKRIPIKEVSIKTVYINDNATSHYNPLRDSYRIYKNFFKYFITIILSFLIELLLFYKFNKLGLNIYYNIIISKAAFIILNIVFIKFVSISLVYVTLILELLLALLLGSISINFLIIKIIIDIVVLVINLLINKK